MNRDHLALIQFVLDHAPSAPVARRVAIYRGLADLCGDQEETKTLHALAAELSAAEAHCQQFAFEFEKKSSSK